MNLGLVLAAAGVVILWLAAGPFVRRRRVRRLAAATFPLPWAQILTRNCSYYAVLPPRLAARLHSAIQVFVADKSFHGCNGLVVNDEMRITIAAHACLLVAETSVDPYPWVRAILVYPHAFLVDREYMDEAGVHSVERQVLAGESWDEGRVIVSWEDIVQDAHCPDAVNVVVHEFAHQLDRASGDVNGAPPMSDGRQRWAEVMAQEYNRLAQMVEQDDTDSEVLDPYGATDPGEFFAVAFEAFVEAPHALAREHPALYDLLRDYSRLDPVSW